MSHEFKDVTGKTEPHFQEPNINRGRSFKFHISNKDRIFQKQAEAELIEAGPVEVDLCYLLGVRQAIPCSPLWGTFSQVKGFYNVNDFQLMDS